ncbi:threonylcarbamoyl-AMP synthase [candidate division KSB1 bacterium 4484_87]|nr:MAG: threonylcarbamoyl-AMP synthase [candidate division KSB1 bacterium 4484_87]
MEIIKLDPKHPDSEELDKAVAIIENGGVIGYPTDTIYGLGADINNDQAVEKVFALKQRQKDKPILILAAWLEQVQSLTEFFSEQAKLLASYFWPGPLTMIFPAANHVNPLVTGTVGTIGVRIPSHRVSLELIRRSGVPITSTSANLSGAPNPTSAEDVIAAFGDKLDAVIDTGPSPTSLPSTIVSVVSAEIKIIREGAISRRKIEEVIGEL